MRKMSLKRHGKNNKPGSLVEHGSRHGSSSEFPSREELVTQLAQLRSSLDGAYETLDSIEPSTDPEVTRKVADMIEIINGLHECEFELMDLLAKDGHVISPTPCRIGLDNQLDKGDEKNDGMSTLGAGGGAGNDANSRAASQEDLSLYGAYAVSSSRSHRNANELSKNDKSDGDGLESSHSIPSYDRVDYIKRLEEIQKINEKLVDRCRRLGLVLTSRFGIDKNMSKMKEVKDIAATKEQAQRKILELKALMRQVAEDKLDSDISLAKIENDESYGRPLRFDTHLPSLGASAISPDVSGGGGGGGGDDENVIKKPRSFLGIVDSSSEAVGAGGGVGSQGPDYSQFLRGLRQPFSNAEIGIGERESAFVPIHNASHLDPTRDKNNRPSNLGGSHGDINTDVKAPRVTGNPSLLRRVIEAGGNQYSQQNISQLEQQRQTRSSSARASLLQPQQPPGVTTLPNNLFRSNYSKSPPSMQSSSGMGSLNSRSMASLENGRNEIHYMPRIASRNQDPDDNISQRAYPPNMSSNNLNKSYRQPTRSSSFYSELDFRNQEVFPPVAVGWEEEALLARASPLRSRSPPEFRRRMLSSIESQQITDELSRVLRCRTSEESLPVPQPNWWSSSTELGQSDRHSYCSEHQNFASRGKSLLSERTIGDCYSQIMTLHIGLQEITQQIRNLTVTVAANKTTTRDALLQHRFDLHNVTRCIRDVSDMVSDSMKRIEAQTGNQTRIMMDIESRLRRIEDNQRMGTAPPKYESTSREREWQVPGRPDFMVSQDLSYFSHAGRDAMRDRDNASGSMLNNQIPPGTRANNYWDNFRSYSRQNMLSKSNANVPQQFSHEASPSSVENSRYTSSDALNNTQPPASGVSDASVDSRRNGTGKNLWATSGFYENMSTKKRNKDQKSQSTTLSSIGKASDNVQNNSAPEPLRTPRDPLPEPDDSNTSFYSNHQGAYSRLSPQISPYRRERDTGREGRGDPSSFSRLSDFEVSWPPTTSEHHRKKYDSELSNRVMQTTDTSNIPAHSPRHEQRDNHFDDTNPNSQLGAPKEDREKHMQHFEVRERGGHSRSTHANLNNDDTQSSSNQELLNSTVDSMGDQWEAHCMDNLVHHSRYSDEDQQQQHMSHSRQVNFDNTESSIREDSDSNEAGPTSSPPNLVSPTVPMNIRCPENALSNENSLGRNSSRAEERDSTTNNSSTTRQNFTDDI